LCTGREGTCARQHGIRGASWHGGPVWPKGNTSAHDIVAAVHAAALQLAGATAGASVLHPASYYSLRCGRSGCEALAAWTRRCWCIRRPGRRAAGETAGGSKSIRHTSRCTAGCLAGVAVHAAFKLCAALFSLLPPGLPCLPHPHPDQPCPPPWTGRLSVGSQGTAGRCPQH
jgi:hypothetical protein